jgi:integrase/recombinase XerD
MQPRRFSIACADWPQRERLFWSERVIEASRYITAERGALLSPRTIRAAQCGFELWLGFLKTTGRYSESLSVREHASPENVNAFIDNLLERRKPISVRSELLRLITCLRLGYGDDAVRWSKPFLQKLNVLVRSYPQLRRPPADSSHLLKLGLSLMQSGESRCMIERMRAIDYRDGLMISLLASRPVRLANFAQMAVDQHLVASSGMYWLIFSPYETKTHVPVHVPLPTFLGTYVDRYLAHVRTVLSPANDLHDRVWCTVRGTPMSPAMIYARVVKRTRPEFGYPVTPHQFRHAAATSQANRDPSRVIDAHRILGHTNYVATERSYNLAATSDGARKLQKHLAERRQILSNINPFKVPSLPMDISSGLWLRKGRHR